jgi:signal transduction histidine kinase
LILQAGSLRRFLERTFSRGSKVSRGSTIRHGKGYQHGYKLLILQDNGAYMLGIDHSAREWGTLERDNFRAMKIRRSTVLAAAFGLLLILIAASSAAVWRNTLRIQDSVATLHQTHKEAADALTRIRSGVYLTATLMRDSLLDPDPDSKADYVHQFETIRSEAEQDLQRLEGFMTDGAQLEALSLLRNELRAYWEPAEAALDLTPIERVIRRMQLLRQRVGKRDEIFKIASQVENLLTANMDREQQRIERTQQQLRSSLAWGTGITLTLGFLIAAFTLMRLLALEQQSDVAAAELRQLSNQLRTAQEEERKYLSRELHDQVGQMLTALRMELAAVAPKDSSVRGQLDRARGTLDSTLKTVRNMAMLLRPSMLDDLGLGPALSWQVKEFSRLTGIAADLKLDEHVDDLPEQHRTCLYRVLQEALTNCARHSQAKHVSVLVTRTADNVRASVADDGIGFAPHVIRRSGMGLLGMEERVRELDGDFRLTSQPGTGTRIDVSLPINPHNNEHKNSDSRRPWHRTRRVEASA